MSVKAHPKIKKSLQAKHSESLSARRLALRHRRKLTAAAGGSVVGGAFFGGSLAGFPGALVGGVVGYGVAMLAAKETKP